MQLFFALIFALLPVEAGVCEDARAFAERTCVFALNGLEPECRAALELQAHSWNSLGRELASFCEVYGRPGSEEEFRAKEKTLLELKERIQRVRDQFPECLEEQSVRAMAIAVNDAHYLANKNTADKLERRLGDDYVFFKKTKPSERFP